MAWRETAEDLQSEQIVLDKVSKLWNCQLQKTEMGCPYDFKALRGNELRCLIEVRRRNILSTAYDEIFMGKQKWTKLHLLSFAYNVPMIFIVIFDDRTQWIDLRCYPHLKETYASRGASPKGGARATDNEASVLIPVKLMKEL